jgi:alpha-amylase/alpha-mannosidase (GH57 family)
MRKKLSIAFVWHMHQPVYKNPLSDEYLMPWVRLHAIKDYLNMALILEKFPKIRQTFNIVPSLIDQLNDYSNNNAHDRHSILTETPVADLTDDDKNFILSHCFDANFDNMIAPHEHYRNLYEKCHAQESYSIDNFSEQEYSDILVWYNLIWFNSHWYNEIPELKQLYDKQTEYTLEERKYIIKLQRDIIKLIIPKYKELLLKGQIELSTSPYYHPILPLLADFSSARRSVQGTQLPECSNNLIDDARKQILQGMDLFKKTFGKNPAGIWPPEQAISPEVLEILASIGIKWTITDEGILAKSLDKEFIRNFHGDLESPYDLSKIYKTEADGKEIHFLCRNSVLADLIGFEYGNHDPVLAANDLYERLKNIQSKLQNSPDARHIVTIALDGENCWESYKENGKDFINKLYELLSEDNSLDVTTVTEYIKRKAATRILTPIYTGSWIDRSFHLWIGDATKNLAWDFLCRTREDLIEFSKENNIDSNLIDKAWNEIYIAEGSDWFWWYGEPNDSGQDDLFDAIFRIRLQNVYRIMGKPVPKHLDLSLYIHMGRPSRSPRGLFSPQINGEISSEDQWINAGCIDMPNGPMFQSEALVRKILFGNDNDNIYFRFDINSQQLENYSHDLLDYEIFIYFIVEEQYKTCSSMRIRSKGKTIYPVQKYLYSYELEIPVNKCDILHLTLSESIENGLWRIKNTNNINYSRNSILELSLPFEDLNLSNGQDVYFTIVLAKSQNLNTVIPQNKLLSLKRP